MPIAISPIESEYVVNFGEKKSELVRFADPLALAIRNGNQEVSEIKPEGITIIVAQTNIPYVEMTISESKEVGFGILVFTIDGEAAEQKLPTLDGESSCVNKIVG